jgi:hypothetical protein
MFSFFTYQIHVNNNLLPNINQIITKYAKLATKGNYLELIQLISVFDRNLALYPKANEKYCRYTSPAIQNEIIGIIAQITRDDITNEIKEAGIFSMMLDETSDVSKDEQFSFVFRYALWGEIFETFLTFKNVTSTTGEILFGTVDITLKEFKLEIKNLGARIGYRRSSQHDRKIPRIEK